MMDWNMEWNREWNVKFNDIHIHLDLEGIS